MALPEPYSSGTCVDTAASRNPRRRRAAVPTARVSGARETESERNPAVDDPGLAPHPHGSRAVLPTDHLRERVDGLHSRGRRLLDRRQPMSSTLRAPPEARPATGCSPSGTSCPGATNSWSGSAPGSGCDRARSSGSLRRHRHRAWRGAHPAPGQARRQQADVRPTKGTESPRRSASRCGLGGDQRPYDRLPTDRGDASLGQDGRGFTLRTYTHLVDDSAERTKRAVDAVFGHRTPQPDPGDLQPDDEGPGDDVEPDEDDDDDV